MQKGNAKLYLGAALVVAAATSVGAQTPTVEVSGRYQALDDRSINERFPAGWNADVAVNIDGAWGVVAEVGGAYRSDADLAIDLTVFTFAGGSRWSGWRASRVAPFAQLLLGLARLGSRADIPGGEIGVSQTKLMLQPSGGVTIAVGQGWGITSQVGYRRIFLDGDHDGDTGFNELIVSAGVRFRF
jgi:hypothetical protein